MKVIALKIDDETYKKLEELARRKGLLSPSEVVRVMILKSLSGETVSHVESEVSSSKVKSVAEKLINIVERRLQDRINPFTSKVDELARKYAELVERLEILEDRIKELEAKISNVEAQIKAKTMGEKSVEVKHEKRKKSLMEILKEQGVLFEEDIAGRIRDRDSFFLKLQRLGAIVLELKNERVAIDPEFWKNFVDKVQSITTNLEEEIAKVLTNKEFRLFKSLRESALIYYDAVSGHWRLLV